MKWSHRWPDQAGWWWSRVVFPDRPKTAAVAVLHVKKNGSGRLCVGQYSMEELHRYGERLWAGPLIPPDTRDVED